MEPARSLSVRGRRFSHAFVASPFFAGMVVVVSIGAWTSESNDIRLAWLLRAFASGLALGLVVEALTFVRLSQVERRRRRSARAFVDHTLACLALMLFGTLWRMAGQPYPYAAFPYDKGGVSRAFAVIASDALGPRGVLLLALAVCILHLRPRWLRTLPRYVRLGVVGKASVRAFLGLTIFAMLAAPALGLVVPPRDKGLSPTVAVARGQLAPSTAPTNVVLIVVSSLRADRIDARLAPTMSDLAARGARFDRAYVSMAQELPSWVTLLTGRHAHHHGIRSIFPTWEERHKNFDTVADRFAREGYATRLVVDSEADLAPRVNLGFELSVAESARPDSPPDSQRTTDRFARELQVLKDQPFFFAIFFSALRFPHVARHPYYSKYTDLDYRGRFKYQTPADPQSASIPEREVADIAQIRALYDGAVSEVDDAVARVLRAIERAGAEGRTLVVITADHGEALYENGHGSGFGGHLFGDESTHVPLVIYDPRIAKGSRSARVVRDVDIAPTLYELAGLVPPHDLDGQSLGPLMRGEDSEARLAYAETALWPSAHVSGLPSELRLPYPNLDELTERERSPDCALALRSAEAPGVAVARHRMVRDDRWKLVYAPTRKGVHYMLFDTLRDPAETRDVAFAYPDELSRLKRELWRWMLLDSGMEPHAGFLVPKGSGSFP